MTTQVLVLHARPTTEHTADILGLLFISFIITFVSWNIFFIQLQLVILLSLAREVCEIDLQNAAAG